MPGHSTLVAWTSYYNFPGKDLKKKALIHWADCREKLPETNEKMLTLGINYSQMHDSAACIVRDGELLFAVAEERISRLKHDARFPHHAIRACLEFAQVRAEQLDEVCFGWQTAGPVFRHDLKCYATR